MKKGRGRHIHRRGGEIRGKHIHRRGGKGRAIHNNLLRMCHRRLGETERKFGGGSVEVVLCSLRKVFIYIYLYYFYCVVKKSMEIDSVRTEECCHEYDIFSKMNYLTFLSENVLSFGKWKTGNTIFY